MFLVHCWLRSHSFFIHCSSFLQVDAHADINTPETTGSGNMHGMPLGFLLGLAKNMNSLPNFGWIKPCVKPHEIVYIGLRDLDQGEKKAIKALGIKAFTVSPNRYRC